MNTNIDKNLIELSDKLTDYWLEHCPHVKMVGGMVLDAERLRQEAHEKGYIEGKAYERGRIAEMLGVSK